VFSLNAIQIVQLVSLSKSSSGKEVHFNNRRSRPSKVVNSESFIVFMSVCFKHGIHVRRYLMSQVLSSCGSYMAQNLYQWPLTRYLIGPKLRIIYFASMKLILTFQEQTVSDRYTESLNFRIVFSYSALPVAIHHWRIGVTASQNVLRLVVDFSLNEQQTLNKPMLYFEVSECIRLKIGVFLCKYIRYLVC